MDSKRQLHRLTRGGFAAPDYVDVNGKLKVVSASDIPLITWPDGSWCHDANTYMRELFEKRLSRRNRGGSLATAAADISHLLRFVWARHISLQDLTDNLFRQFIGGLLNERKLQKPEQLAREASRVLAIGRSCLQFLDCVARYRNDDSLLGEHGRVCAVRRVREVKIGGGSGVTSKKVSYWHHPALPQPEAKHRRLPISSKNIELLRKAVPLSTSSSHLRMRRHVMLKLLEITGARRGEIAELTVSAVMKASQMDAPMLLVPTFKKRGGRTRERLLPISVSDSRFLVQYAEFYRGPLMRRRKRHGPDNGLFLVSDVTGRALTHRTITAEVARLAKIAAISERACPHMFRHRFITKLFVALIERHRAETPDSFRRLLLDTEELKRKVAEWTDHSDLETLSGYIDLAFDEIENFSKTYKLVSAGLSIDSFLGTLEAELQQLHGGEAPVLAAARLIELTLALKADLESARAAEETRCTT